MQHRIDIAAQFADAIQAAGLNPPPSITADGQLHRFATNGKRDDDSGWYILHGDGIPAGAYGCWRKGINENWRADVGRTLTPAEEAAYREKMDAARRKSEINKKHVREEAAATAMKIWNESVPASDSHPYLQRKRIKPYGIRAHDEVLVIPFEDKDGKLCSLQSIKADGEKCNLSGGRTGGCFFVIGDSQRDTPLCIAEGYATAATIHEETGYPIVVAFNAGNLQPVAKVMRDKFPHRELVICADDDAKTEGNPGLTKATAAAAAVAARLVVPDFGTDRPDGVSDFNDLMLLRGVGAVKSQIEESLSNKAQNSYDSYNSYARPKLKAEALYGLAGDIVKAIEPYSESDPVSTLVNILTAFGNDVGPTPHARVEETEHHVNLFIVQVGDTSKGRKGTSWSTPRKMFRDIDPEWADKRITGGLSSGEGLVYNVRDPRTQTKPIREDGKVIGYEDVLVDKGEEDKRLLLIEEEFSQALKVMSREGNILSPIIRQAWDHGNLRSLTKNDPNRATGAHISIIAHITRGELLRHLVETEQTNGFANRFIWLLVARSKEIPRPKGVPAEILSPLAQKLTDAIDFARRVIEIDRDDDANREWDDIYHYLSDAKPGLTGALIARAEAQVLRLSCLYALLDQSALIRAEHQRAALALWEYSDASVKAIFGDMTGDPNLDTAKAALMAKGELTLTDLHALFGRNASSAEVDRVMAALVKMGLATIETAMDTRGRKSITTIRWATKSTKSTKSTQYNS